MLLDITSVLIFFVVFSPTVPPNNLPISNTVLGVVTVLYSVDFLSNLGES